MIGPFLFGLTILTAATGTALAQAACHRDAMRCDAMRCDAMIVFDGSGSMAENGFNLLDEPRIHAARRAAQSATRSRALPHIDDWA